MSTHHVLRCSRLWENKEQDSGGLELGPQNLCKMLGVVGTLGENRDRRTLETHWLASLGYLASPRSQWLSLSQKHKVNSVPYTQQRTCTHAHTTNWISKWRKGPKGRKKSQVCLPLWPLRGLSETPLILSTYCSLARPSRDLWEVATVFVVSLGKMWSMGTLLI